MPWAVNHRQGISAMRSQMLSRHSQVNEILAMNIETKAIMKRISLIRGNIETISLDPMGRFWAGYSSDSRIENREQVFTEGGRYSRIVHTEDNPETGIVFSGGKAFIACTRNGFHGAVDVFDLRTFERRKTICLSSGKKWSPYFLSAVAASKSMIVAAGMTNRPDQKEN
jgi:hypothetical protein